MQYSIEEKNIVDIAVVGMACRFPGANNYQQFWANLDLGVNSIGEIPSSRWKIEQYYSPRPQDTNKTISKWGGFIEGIDKFDAQFFGISPREAKRIDPQQRILLELSWSCLEDAGYAPSQLSGHPVGVFMGVCNYDYDQLQHQQGRNIDGHSGTGTWNCMLPNRISSYFNFHGPSIPIDTACSSSLVALHYAINALSKAECQIALVGGVSICCLPTRYIQMSQLGMLSPTGKCKTFDSQADGYVRGEGAGIVLLKPLSEALEDEDRIYAVIKGSAINHGGSAKTLTSPNIYAQAQVLRAAYTQAKIPPNTVSYIEAHGTGTPLGDPIEINALKRGFKHLYKEFGLPLSAKNYCGLGAVKTNIGHLEGAAGIAGVIKVLLAMQHKKLPKLVNFQQLNPRIDLNDSPFYLITETQPWQPFTTDTGEEIPRRAGVSSFGIGGVNAHVILEEAPVGVSESQSSSQEPLFHLFTLSAKTEKALHELVSCYQTYLELNPELSFANICYTANIGRSHFKYRLAILASNLQELGKKLTTYQTGDQETGLWFAQIQTQSPVESSSIDPDSPLEDLAQRYVKGETVDWGRYYTGRHYRKLALPTYSFQRESYWLDPYSPISLSPTRESSSSLVVDLLNQGSVQGLIEHLHQSESFTDGEKSLLSKLLNVLINQHQNPGSSNKKLTIPEKIQASSLPNDRLSLIIEYLQGLLTELLGWENGQKIDIQNSFTDLGMDYAQLLELSSKLQDTFGFTVVVTQLLEYFNVQKLSGYILNQMDSQDIPARSALTNPSPPITVREKNEDWSEKSIETAIQEADMATAIENELNQIQFLLNKKVMNLDD